MIAEGSECSKEEMDQICQLAMKYDCGQQY